MAAEPTNKQMLKQLVEGVDRLCASPQANIHALTKEISEFRAEQREFMIRQESINEKVADNHEILEGNGKEGIKSIVRGLKKEMGAIKKVTWIIAGTILTGVTGYLLSLVMGV